MKLSVSLPDEDVEFLDEYAERAGIGSRSAAVHKAIRVLQAAELGESYESAWGEWESDGSADLWDSTSADGIGDAPR